MAMLSQPSFGPRVALAYITSGALLDIWTVVHYFAFERPAGAMSNMTWFWLVGFFLTGIILVLIGLLLGPIGQAARKAELPPPEAVNAEARIQQTAAQVPHPVMAPPAGAVAPPVVPAAPAGVAPIGTIPVRR